MDVKNINEELDQAVRNVDKSDFVEDVEECVGEAVAGIAIFVRQTRKRGFNCFYSVVGFGTEFPHEVEGLLRAGLRIGGCTGLRAIPRNLGEDDEEPEDV